MPLDEAEEEFEMIVVTRTELIVESNKAVKLDESPVTTWQPLEIGSKQVIGWTEGIETDVGGDKLPFHSTGVSLEVTKGRGIAKCEMRRV